jgi:hypothetical protein
MISGIASLGNLLAGDFEGGITRLSHGDSQINEDRLRIAIQAQLLLTNSSLENPTIIIDSNNMIQIDKLTDFSFEVCI